MKGFLRLDRNISDEHRLTVRHNIVSAKQDKRCGQNTAYTLTFWLEIRFFSAFRTILLFSLTVHLEAIPQTNFVVSYMSINDRRGDFAGGVFPFVSIGVGSNGEVVIMGVEPFSQANSLNQSILEITNDFTLFAGNHSITIGTHNEIYGSANVFFPWYFGNYLFGSVGAFDCGMPFDYINRISIDVAKYGKTPAANFSSAQIGLYVRDEWDVSKAAWNAMNTFITNDPVLSQYRGQFVPRNAGREPWVNELDLSVIQDIPTGVGRIQLTANIFNVLNLLNPSWGYIQFVTRPSQGDFSGQTRYGIAKFNGYEMDGRMRLDFQTPQGNSIFVRDNLLSRRQMQIGVRYIF